MDEAAGSAAFDGSAARGVRGWAGELEGAWLARAAELTRANGDRDALQRVAGDVRRLTDRFTTGRKDGAGVAGGYLKDGRTAAAYALWFGAQAYARTAQVLAALPGGLGGGDGRDGTNETDGTNGTNGTGETGGKKERGLRVVVGGAGTGGDLFAVLDAVAGGGERVEAVAVDESRTALRELREVFGTVRGRWSGTTLRTRVEGLAEYFEGEEDGRADLVVLGYVLNEMDAASARRVLGAAARRVRRGGWLVVCEPLVRAEGDWMRELREWAREGVKPLELAAPCPQAGACPLGEACHSVRTWTLPRSVQILNSGLRRDVRHLAYAWLAWRNGGGERIGAWSTGCARAGKGHHAIPACLTDGTSGEVRVLHRNLDTAGKRRLKRVERGMRVDGFFGGARFLGF